MIISREFEYRYLLFYGCFVFVFQNCIDLKITFMNTERASQLNKNRYTRDRIIADFSIEI